MVVMKFVLGNTGLAVGGWYENNFSLPYPTWTNILPPPKRPEIRNSLNNTLIFNQLERLKTDASSTNIVTLRLAN